MNKASKWLRSLFAGKKSHPDSDSHSHLPSNKKWPFPFISKSHARNLKEKKHPSKSQPHKPQQTIKNHNIESQGQGGDRGRSRSTSSREAMWLTGRPNKYSTTYVTPPLGRDHDLRRAAVTIQSHFRGYLSRRALRALKALVKLQALVRGHILRKQMGNVMRQMEALARAQARARIGRVLNSQGQHQPSPTTPQRIIEVDTWRTETTPRRRRRIMFHSSDLSYCSSFSTSKDHTARQTNVSGEVRSFGHLKHDAEDSSFYTPDSSPKVYSSSASSRRGGGPFTPEKGESSSRRRLSSSANHPNYMAYTESSKAKARSFSAPKQRHHYYEPVHVLYAAAEARPNVHKASALQALFSRKAYPGSGHLDRLAVP